jgi:phosphate transport system substrate-binding protein
MKTTRLAIAAFAAAGLSISTFAADITGAGATFPYPIYAKWADAYRKATGNGMNYQSIGSGGGIKQITAKTVDFGASDMPMKPDDLAKNGLVQFPAGDGRRGAGREDRRHPARPAQVHRPAAGRHLPRQGEEVERPGHRETESGREAPRPGDRADLSLRRVRHHLPLHQLPLEGQRRFQGRGGRRHVGQVPRGRRRQGQRGRRVVRAEARRAIGYVEYAYAKQNRLAYTMLQNRSGKFVEPDDETFKAAAANADWKSVPGMGVVLTDQQGDKAWPITGASFILLHAKQERAEAGREVLKFFEWAYRNGGAMAQELDYVPMPEPVVKQVQGAWKGVTDASGRSLY